MPKNPDGSIRCFLYRWDDGKNGTRHLARCRECGSLYLVQAYHIHKFSNNRKKKLSQKLVGAFEPLKK